MLVFLMMVLVVLVGIALAIFGCVAAIAGVLWLLWPLVLIAGAMIGIGYLIGRHKEKKGDKNGEPIDGEFEEIE